MKATRIVFCALALMAPLACGRRPEPVRYLSADVGLGRLRQVEDLRTTTTLPPPPPTTVAPAVAAHVAHVPPRASREAPPVQTAAGPCDRPSTCPQLRSCEHGGSYTAGNNPRYKFAYQFSRSTWISLGAQTKEGIAASAAEWDTGTASPAEQDARADALYFRSGRGQWPICGRFLR